MICNTRYVLLVMMLFCSISIFAQLPTVKMLASGKRVSIRGLGVVDDKTVWISGSNGTVAKSVDGGQNWNWITVPGYEKRDFRDIAAFDANTAVIIGISEPAVILKTTDGGQTWKKVMEDTTKGMFLDAMDFFDAQHGVVIGDPLGSSIYLAFTDDGGDSWQKITAAQNESFMAKQGEAFFASSGTNIKLLDKKHGIAFASGGKQSGIFLSGKRDSLPIMQGKETTGANSIAVYHKKAVVGGGDFYKDTIANNNCVLVSLGKRTTFSKPSTPPHGYRSCVIYTNADQLVSCGTSGIDVSTDGGMNWQLVTKEGFNVCQKAKKGNIVYLAGGGGKIAKLILP